MSAKDIRNTRGERRMPARVIRVRNRCIASLAARRALPVPTEAEVAAMDDGLGLSAAWLEWTRSHAPPAELSEPSQHSERRRMANWRSPRVAGSLLAVLVFGVLGLVFRDRWFQLAKAQLGPAAVAPTWMPVTDSVAATLGGKLLTVGATDVRLPVTLSAAEVASMVFGSPLGSHRPRVDSLEARVDSLLWIRGRLRGASRFHFGGRLALRRPGLAEFRIARVVADSAETNPMLVARLLSGRLSAVADSARVRFQVPLFVASIRIENGAAPP